MLEGLTPARSKARPCAVVALINRLDEADGKILSDAVKNVQRWTASSLSAALKERGLTIADMTITRHRNKLCVCYKS